MIHKSKVNYTDVTQLSATGIQITDRESLIYRNNLELSTLLALYHFTVLYIIHYYSYKCYVALVGEVTSETTSVI